MCARVYNCVKIIQMPIYIRRKLLASNYTAYGNISVSSYFSVCL